MIDFTNCREIFNIYKGSEKKKTLIYEGKRYLVKFPDPIREKNKSISYINNAFSEYVGSNIFRLCGFDTQNTILGKYKNKIVCACEDFTDSIILYEFENLTLSSVDKKITTEISEIMEVLDENGEMLDVGNIKKKFWDMFIIDALIGNTNRHNGNWGFSLNDEGIGFSKIYDCGSCLNPLLEDEDIKKLSESELKNLAINSYSCLRENGRKINSLSYIKKHENIDCCDALKRVFNNIDINKINSFIKEIDCISEVRKEFYLYLINERYKMLEKVYNELLDV